MGVADPSRLTAAQLKQAVDAMLTVKPNIVTIGASFADMADVMVRGDASIGICGWAYQTMIAKEKGVELEGRARRPTTAPTTGRTPTPSPSTRRIVDNAYAFIDFMTLGRSRMPQSPPSSAPAAPSRRPSIFSTRRCRSLYPYDIVRKPDGGILGTQIVVPPQEPDGDIVGAPAWVEAWQTFKLA